MIAKQERNSSMELFRILATFLVLIVHWNGWFVGGLPEQIGWSDLSTFRFGQLIIWGLSICCVNCFILLSGYFSIKLKKKSVINLWVTIVSVFIPFYLYECVRDGTFSVYELLCWGEGFSRSGYFIQNYFLLMFFSPLLNSFVERNKENVTKWTLAFFLLEFWFFCIMNVETMGFERGYSFIHFVLMYMIGRSIYINKEWLKNIKRKYWFAGYLTCVLASCVLYVLNIDNMWEYCNPFVIGSSICLLMCFANKSFYSKTINYIAISTLPVYIMQCFNPGYRTLVTIDNQLLDSLPYYQYLLASAGVISLFFCLCIIYDKIRLKVTTPITNYIYRRLGI